MVVVVTSAVGGKRVAGVLGLGVKRFAYGRPPSTLLGGPEQKLSSVSAVSIRKLPS